MYNIVNMWDFLIPRFGNNYTVQNIILLEIHINILNTLVNYE